MAFFQTELTSVKVDINLGQGELLTLVNYRAPDNNRKLNVWALLSSQFPSFQIQQHEKPRNRNCRAL
jgi:hypothetical protein